MNTQRALIPGLMLAAFIVTGGPAAYAEETGDAAARRGAELFEKNILPILEEHCFVCHSSQADEIQAGLELDSPAGLRRGGDSGPMFTAHDPESSRLLRMLRHDADEAAMPPDDRLPDEVIAAFAEWIRLGAPDTREDSGPTVREQRLKDSMKHWSFVPVRPVSVPPVQNTDWPRNRLIDPFILARMEAAGVRPVRDAGREALIRRLSFDLTGLPPTPEEIDAFLNDRSPDAVERVVDRLLASPHFGERWGRHWLDVVRYAESSGMEFNFTYPHAWPYRDYVIDAFNDDRPFDVFLTEQIAGDLLPAEDGDSPEDIQTRRVAAGLLAFGPKRHNSGGMEFRMDIVDDQIDVVFKSTMALTVSCARCHDHKFDPIPTRDYYALAGIFLSTEPLYGTIKQKYSNNPTELLPLGPDGAEKHRIAEAHEKQIAAADKTVQEKETRLKEAVAAEEEQKARVQEADQLLAAVTSRLEASSDTDPAAAEAERTRVEQAAAQARTELSQKTEQKAAAEAELKAAKAHLEELKKNRPPRPRYAMTARDREKPADTKLAIRGDYRTPGDVVPRGFLSAVHVPDSPPVNPEQSGRLELARWIASPHNPLTARVMVNRIWQHLMGRGIVPTVDNFGLIGKPPSHPELLDALARHFVEQGWSVKDMIRQIVLSRTYQLSTVADPDNLAIDPDNRLFWRAEPRRLEAEAIRDAMLSVSGRLDRTPPDGSSVTALGDQLVRGIAPEKIQPPSRHRSVYLPVVRDYVPEIFDLFDFPSPSLVRGRRAVTNVPSQALYLRNSAFAAQQARSAAERLLAWNPSADDAARVDHSMRLAYGRRPTDQERTAILNMIRQVRDAEQQAGADETNAVQRAWTAWFLTLFSSAEFRYLVDTAASSEGTAS